MKKLKKKKHTGSVGAQYKQDRDLTAENPVGSISLQGSPNEHRIGIDIKILSLNVEGLSMPKCDYLANLLAKHDIDILALQETHIGDEAAPSRYTIQNYTLIQRLNHNQYGTMIYAREPTLVTHIETSITVGDIHTMTIKFGEITNKK